MLGWSRDSCCCKHLRVVGLGFGRECRRRRQPQQQQRTPSLCRSSASAAVPAAPAVRSVSAARFRKEGGGGHRGAPERRQGEGGIGLFGTAFSFAAYVMREALQRILLTDASKRCPVVTPPCCGVIVRSWCQLLGARFWMRVILVINERGEEGGVNPRALWEWWRSVRRKIDRKETQKNTSSAWGAFVAHAHVSLSLFSQPPVFLFLSLSPQHPFLCLSVCVRVFGSHSQRSELETCRSLEILFLVKFVFCLLVHLRSKRWDISFNERRQNLFCSVKINLSRARARSCCRCPALGCSKRFQFFQKSLL